MIIDDTDLPFYFLLPIEPVSPRAAVFSVISLLLDATPLLGFYWKFVFYSTTTVRAFHSGRSHLLAHRLEA